MKKAKPIWDKEKTLRFTDPQYGNFEVVSAKEFLLNGEEVPYEAQEGFFLVRKTVPDKIE